MDPCASYRAAVHEALPQARIVADHFHLVRLANQAVTDVRRRVTWTPTAVRGRKTDLGLGRPTTAAPRAGTAVRGLVHPHVERPHRRRPDRQDPHRVDREGTAAGAARDRPAWRVAARRRAPAPPVQHLVRQLRPARARAPRRHHRGVVAEVLGFLQTQVTNAGTEATNRTVKTAARTRLRLPQPRQPTPPSTVRLAPGDHAGPPPAEGAFPSSSMSPLWSHR